MKTQKERHQDFATLLDDWRLKDYLDEKGAKGGFFIANSHIEVEIMAGPGDTDSYYASGHCDLKSGRIELLGKMAVELGARVLIKHENWVPAMVFSPLYPDEVPTDRKDLPFLTGPFTIKWRE